MSWLSWQRYRCATKCNDATSADCFNEKLIRDTADALVSEGYKDVGYEYVCLDDCWQAPRGKDGHMAADANRFPSGIKALAAYVHSKGLKLGLYTAVGSKSCAGRPGLDCNYDAIPKYEQAKRDIEDFVSWDIDHIIVDGCGGFDIQHMNESYDIIGRHLLNATIHRGTGPVAYHPSNLGFGFPRQFRELASIGNQWRFFNDIQASWGSLAGIIEEIGAGQPECVPGPLPANCTGRLRSNTKPTSTWCASYCVERRDAFLAVPGRGGWHDPDMLLIGNTPCSVAGQKAGMSCANLTHDEEKMNMAIWAMASAPLQISVDVKAVPAASKAILQNKEIIAVNQDPLGRMGFRFLKNTKTGAQGWKKELIGVAVAVALANMGTVSPGPDPVPPPGLDDCDWHHTVNSYVEACGGAKGDVYCGDLGTVEVAKQR
jgi:alpha-galactosidase